MSRRLAEPFLDFTGTGDDEEILDVGCGTGNLAFSIANRAKTKSIKGIRTQKRVSKMPKAPQITFEVADATALP